MSSREPTFPDGRATGKKRGREKAADILQLSGLKMFLEENSKS